MMDERTKFGLVMATVTAILITILIISLSSETKPLGELKENTMHSVITNDSMLSFNYDGEIVYTNWTRDEEGDYASRDYEIRFYDKKIVEIISENCYATKDKE